jgi:hypothetical protein
MKNTKVLVKLKNKKQDLGYLLKQISKNCYEVWCENYQTIMILSKKDFIIVEEKDE